MNEKTITQAGGGDGQAMATTLGAPSAQVPAIPISISGYQLFEVVGSGGMGVVYRAHDLALNRDVAVKVLLDSYAPNSGTAARFVEEAQITSQLQHPGIPAIYAVGRIADERPWLAMKLIKGRTLDDLLRSGERLNALAVFEAMAQAVGYAHAHGVIHRDLKPHNIMVGAFGEVQVMDWGLAKLLASREREQPEEPTATVIHSPRATGTPYTQAGSILGTPAYMPPEQAAGLMDDVNERADVFGLGAILCQMLSGVPPFAGKDVESVRRNAVRGVMDESMAKLATCDADPDVVALCRKCLSFEPGERPANAGELAKQVAALRAAADERARAAEVERARAEVHAAEQRKRRRVLQLAGGAVAAVLVLGIIGTTYGLIRAADRERLARKAEERAVRERNTAVMIRNLLKNDLLLQANSRIWNSSKSKVAPVEGRSTRDPRISELLDVANEKFSEEEIEKRLPGEPLIQAEILETMAESYRVLRTNEKSAALYKRVLAIRLKTEGPQAGNTVVARFNFGLACGLCDQPDVMITEITEVATRLNAILDSTTLSREEVDDALDKLAINLQPMFEDDATVLVGPGLDTSDRLRLAGKLLVGLYQFEQLLKKVTTRYGPKDERTLQVRVLVAYVHGVTSQRKQAIDEFREIVRVYAEIYGTDNAKTLTARTRYLSRDWSTSDLTQHKSNLENHLRDCRRVFGDVHAETAYVMAKLANCYKLAGDAPRALPLLEEALQVDRILLGLDHTITLTKMNILALGYKSAKKYDQAIPLLQELLKIQKVRRGPDHSITLNIMRNLADCYRLTGKLDLALLLYEERFELRKAKKEPDHADTISAMADLAYDYQLSKKFDLAIPLWLKVLEHRKINLPPDDSGTQNALHQLVECYRLTGKLDLALPLYEKEYELRKAKQGPDHVDTIDAMADLAFAYQTVRKFDLAIPLWQKVLEHRKLNLPPNDRFTLNAMNQLAECYRSTGKPDVALPLFKDLLEIQKVRLGPDNSLTLNIMRNLADCYRQANKPELAMPLRKEEFDRRKAKQGADHSDTLNAMQSLALACKTARNYDEALKLFRELHRLRTAKQGADHPGSRLMLAMCCQEAGKHDEALTHFQELLKLGPDNDGLDPISKLIAMDYIAGRHQVNGNLGLALPLFETAARGVLKKKDTRSTYAWSIINNTVNAYKAANDLPAAETWHWKWQVALKANEGPDSLEYAGVLAPLGAILLQRSEWTEAESVCRECLAIRRKLSSDAWNTFSMESMLGAALMGQKKYPEAGPLLTKGYEGMKAREKQIPPGANRLREATQRLVDYYTATNQPAKAKEWQAKLPIEFAPPPRRSAP